MKRILLMLALMAGVVQVYAQLEVDDFSQRINDMSARATDKPVVDQNGDPCALIKVFAPQVEGFTFYGGAQSGFLTWEPKGGEMWVYVPATALQMTISHPTFGRVEYEYPMALRPGTTYQMLLNIGSGRFVTINSNGAAQARVAINGKYVGETPIYNHFLPYGTYQVEAEKDRFEGHGELKVARGNKKDEKQQFFSIEMVDQTPHYGDVTITVEDDPNADIFYQGKRVGAGTWKTLMKEGAHEVVTRKRDCTDATTLFNVTAQTLNAVKAQAPVPHTGTIHIDVHPRSAKVLYDGNKEIDLSEPRVLPVGRHEFSFIRKDYQRLEKSYEVERDMTLTDTVSLAYVNYLKNVWGFYFGAGYTQSSLSGITGYIGGVVRNFDLQLSYTFGLKSSHPAYMYDTAPETGNEMLSGNKYKMNTMAAHLGYQIRLIPRLGITPQVGYMYQMLSAKLVEGSGKFADGASAHNLTLGVKILGVPMQHMYLFLTPEYALPLKRSNDFRRAADAADFRAGGFSISMGILVNFGNK